MSRLLTLLAAGDPGFDASNYMPDVKVEIAWSSGYNTPAADRVWTDVSEWVELADSIGMDHGRQDERSTADANDLTLVLDNSDGRFTAGRAASPYYPNVKLGRPVRVSLMTVTGYTSVRFVGFIDEWPVEWDGTDAYAKASVRATSRLARLGLSTKLRSMPEQEILAAGPFGYWTMGDPTGSTSAAESSGAGGSPMTLAATGSGSSVVFGNATGPGADGLTALDVAGTASWSGGVAPVQFAGEHLVAGSAPTEVRGLRASVRLAGLPGAGAHAYVVNGGSQIFEFSGNVDFSAIAIDELGRVRIRGLTGPSINDGATHDLLLAIVPGVEARLYVDGVSAGVGTVPVSASPSTYRVGQGFAGTISHVAAYATTPTADQAAAQAALMGAATSVERTDERLTRILGWAGVAASEITTEAGVETMTYQQTSGQPAVDALRECEATESGVLFDGRDGNVVFHGRSRRYTATPAATLDMAAQHVGSDYAPKLDRSTLVNEVRVENPTTGWTADVTNEASRDEYGVATGSSKAVTDTYAPLVQKAYWLIASYAEPRARVPSLTVDVLAHVGLTPSAETLLGLGVGDLIEVVNQPTQADATTAKYFIEGYAENIGPESYSITFNLSPSHPHLSVVVLDDPDRGLDSGSILAL